MCYWLEKPLLQALSCLRLQELYTHVLQVKVEPFAMHLLCLLALQGCLDEISVAMYAVAFGVAGSRTLCAPVWPLARAV